MEGKKGGIRNEKFELNPVVLCRETRWSGIMSVLNRGSSLDPGQQPAMVRYGRGHGGMTSEVRVSASGI